jgi:hypothetical protein
MPELARKAIRRGSFTSVRLSELLEHAPLRRRDGLGGYTAG